MLEEQIKDLEERLEFKKALMSVVVSFGKGNKFSEEVKLKISTAIKGFCESLLDDKEAQVIEKEGLSPQEITILKQIAAKVLAKAEAPAVAQEPVKEKPAQAKSEVRATVMLLDNVDPSVRKKLSPLSIVRVVGKMNAETALVETEEGFRFHVPIDDLDFEINK